MKAPVLLTGLLALVCLATLAGVWSQRNQIASLRAEQRQWVAQRAAQARSAESAGAPEALGAAPAAPTPALAGSPELLRLRNEVTRLTERRRELEAERAENEKLRADLASRGASGLAATQPPPGYIRKSEAQMVGFNTPENTLQTLLWASRNHDLTNLLQAYVPDRAEEMREQMTAARAANKDFFRDQIPVPGLRVLGKRQDPEDGSVYLEMELLPGMPHETIQFQQTNGQWKIARD
jgi:hypothetical protein